MTETAADADGSGDSESAVSVVETGDTGGTAGASDEAGDTGGTDGTSDVTGDATSDEGETLPSSASAEDTPDGSETEKTTSSETNTEDKSETNPEEESEQTAEKSTEEQVNKDGETGDGTEEDSKSESESESELATASEDVNESESEAESETGTEPETENVTESESEQEFETESEESFYEAEVVTDEGIRVSVSAAAGVLPANARLVAELIGTTDDDTTDTSDLEQTLDIHEVEYDGFIAIDVHFEDEDGNELEPDGAVAVFFVLPEDLLPEDADTESLSVQHLAEDANGNVTDVETVAAADPENVAAADAGKGTDGTSSNDLTRAENEETEIGTVGESGTEIVAEFVVDGFSTFTVTYKTYSFTAICIDTDGNVIEKDMEATTTSQYWRLSATNSSYLYTKEGNADPSIEGYTYLRASCALRGKATTAPWNASINYVICTSGIWRANAIKVVTSADDDSVDYTDEDSSDSNYYVYLIYEKTDEEETETETEPETEALTVNYVNYGESDLISTGTVTRTVEEWETETQLFGTGVSNDIIVSQEGLTYLCTVLTSSLENALKIDEYLGTDSNGYLISNTTYVTANYIRYKDGKWQYCSNTNTLNENYWNLFPEGYQVYVIYTSPATVTYADGFGSTGNQPYSMDVSTTNSGGTNRTDIVNKLSSSSMIRYYYDSDPVATVNGTAYTFAGWCLKTDANGNGTGECYTAKELQGASVAPTYKITNDDGSITYKNKDAEVEYILTITKDGKEYTYSLSSPDLIFYARWEATVTLTVQVVFSGASADIVAELITSATRYDSVASWPTDLFGIVIRSYRSDADSSATALNNYSFYPTEANRAFSVSDLTVDNSGDVIYTYDVEVASGDYYYVGEINYEMRQYSAVSQGYVVYKTADTDKTAVASSGDSTSASSTELFLVNVDTTIQFVNTYQVDHDLILTADAKLIDDADRETLTEEEVGDYTYLITATCSYPDGEDSTYLSTAQQLPKGIYSVVSLDEDGEESQAGTDENGDLRSVTFYRTWTSCGGYTVYTTTATVTVKAGETIAIKRLPGFTYTVSEVTDDIEELSGGYEFQYYIAELSESTNNSKSAAETKNNSVEASLVNGDAGVTITNYYSHSAYTLTVTKLVCNPTGTTYGDVDSFAFSLTVKDSNGTAYTESLSASKITLETDETAKKIESLSLVYDAESKGYGFELADGQSVEIAIPYGYTAEVSEAAYSNYLTTSEIVMATASTVYDDNSGTEEQASLTEDQDSSAESRNQLTVSDITTDTSIVYTNTKMLTVPTGINRERLSDASESAIKDSDSVVGLISSDEEPYVDSVAWITIDGTNISYPVAQGEDNMEYVDKDIEGNFSLSGSIFLDCRNASDFSDSYNIVYGHNLGNGQMFSDLLKYTDQEYFETHTSGSICMAGETCALEIFACAEVSAYDSVIYNPLAWTAENREELLNYISENAVQFDETKSTNEGSVIAFSTCVSEDTEERIVVFGCLCRQ
ncbi:MAG: class B sortase [Clostridiales bacterium]|nr:class B sortase [Clostridiales bacterium]